MATRHRGAGEWVPPGRDLATLDTAVQRCHGCDLYQAATQAVFGEGAVDAGIDRDTAYPTNAVKHFRYQREGRRRLHMKPDVGHIVACGPWLTAELEALEPDVEVVLGAVAAVPCSARRTR